MEEDKIVTLLEAILTELKDIHASINKISADTQESFSALAGPGSGGNLAKIQERLKKIERALD